MQKKHLQLLLLILVLGCSKPQLPEQNPYILNKQQIDLSFSPSGKSKTVSLFGSELRISARQARGQSMFYRNPAFLKGEMILNWSGGLVGNEDVLDVYSAGISRTLTSFLSETPDAELHQRAIPLPAGSGLVLYLEDERPASMSLLLTETIAAYSAQTPSRVNEKTYRLRTDDLASFFVIAGDRGIEKVTKSAPQEVRLDLSKKTTQVVLSFGTTAEAAEKVAIKYLGKSRKVVEAEMAAELQSIPAFSLNTSDDRTNQAFALLTSSLCGASRFLKFQSREDIETNSQCATGLYLASRQQPFLFMSDSSLADSHFTSTQRLLWGWRAHQAVLKYGMADEKTLTELAGDIMTELDVLHEELFLEKNILDNDMIQDTLLRHACSQIQVAGLFTLGEEISRAAGNNMVGDNMRKQALDAMKAGRRFYSDYNKQYDRWEKKKELSKLASVVDDEETPVKAKGKNRSKDNTDSNADIEIEIHEPQTRDFLSFVLTGARAGFNWLSEASEQMIFAAPMDGFIWQKWISYHYLKDLRISQTNDQDSLLSIMLEGGNPGLVTFATPEGDTLPDYVTMSAALQNYAEIYLGYRPMWKKNHVDLYPRTPPSWGHTAARLPFGPGFIHLDYDFVRERVRISMSGIQEDVSFVFGYPLESLGALTGQFKLSKERPFVELRLIHKKDKMLELEIEDDN